MCGEAWRENTRERGKQDSVRPDQGKTAFSGLYTPVCGDFGGKLYALKALE